MDDFDDIDDLLDFEAGLEDGQQVANKRSIADVRSQYEAASSRFGGDAKRTRLDPAAADNNDDELLQLAAQVAPSQPLQSSAPRLAFTLPSETEDQELLLLAAQVQPSQSQAVFPAKPAPFKRSVGNADDPDFDIDAMLDMEVPQGSALADGRLKPDVAAAGEGAGPAAAEQPAQAAPTRQQPHRQALESILPRREYLPPSREAIRVSGSFLTVTSQDGERVYVQVAEAGPPFDAGRNVDIAGALRRARGGLLSTDINALLEAVERDQFERTLADTAADAARQVVSQRTPGTVSRAGGGAGARERGAAPCSSLWVDKYSPRSFMNLLSDEHINRDVVRWLKTWDPCVFGTAAPAAAAAASSNPRGFRAGAGRRNAENTRGGGGGPSRRTSTGGGNTHVDSLGRPEHKIILLCGPPGLGKTTLAHVVARHCGYRPVEINASDDRSSASLLARVLDAVEMQAVMGEKRPNCVIIDEVDGAAGGAEGRSAIAALLKIVNAMPGKGKAGEGEEEEAAKAPTAAAGDGGSDSEEERGAGADAAAEGGKATAGAARRGGSKARTVQLRPLMRPIIAICNDLYAPALRPLRDVARVFHFRRPSAERLGQRLEFVCSAEGLGVEKSTLRLLAERAECDVRSCLNTLQFLSKRQRHVRQADLAGLGVGQKDMTKGAFQVWGELLQTKRAPSIVGRVAESEGQRSSRLFSLLQDFGEPELVLGGIHENLPSLHFFDMALTRTTQVLGHLQDADETLHRMQRSGEFSLLKYLPAAALAVSSLVAGPEKPALTWPRAAGEARRRTAANRAVLQQWMLGMAPAAYAALGPAAAAMELLPMLPHLTTPALRPVSKHLFSPEEHAAVGGLVGTLLTLGLNFSLHIEAGEGEEDAAAAAALAGRPSRMAAQEPPLQFRPPVHRLWAFSGHKGCAGRLMPLPTRQMVSHEAEMEGIRRAEAGRRAAVGQRARASPGAAAMDVDEAGPSGRSSTAASQPKAQGRVQLDLAQRLREAGVAARAKASTAAAPRGTWLDQLRDRKHVAQRQADANANGADAEGRGGAGRLPVLYKFHEGYTNAIKRPVRMAELLR